ncbi:hypothetical protein [Nostoc sp. DedQUE07]|uniref:hypothetical protein n=1 Tax=Nostoc sp. DedQUE07 TaxID=3075392 RepID=UPI002AD1D81E|nr:hypothetical protein [Nostoc sp. DedQUE07]MDZ8131910.1 hypothetical protein [Nostoc sp. DedQUE07]
MDVSQIAVADRVDTKSVMATLNIGKSLFYGTYTKDCKITPVRVGNQSFISGVEFELLRAYHLARCSGKEVLAEFLKELSPTEDNSDKPSLDRSLILFDNLTLQANYQKLSSRLSLLEQYASSPHARLSNQELSQVLELSPSTLYGNKEHYRLGFVFRRDRQGWQVLIPENNSIPALAK